MEDLRNKIIRIIISTLPNHTESRSFGIGLLQTAATLRGKPHSVIFLPRFIQPHYKWHDIFAPFPIPFAHKR
jgi:hypothetical protein